MKLDGNQRKQIYDALLEAFTYESLEVMLGLNLDKSLQQIAPVGSNFSSVVFALVRAAEQQGWVLQLVSAAHEWVPLNERLAALALALQPPAIPPVAEPGTPPPPSRTSSAALPKINPDKPPYAALRRLLLASFSPETLFRFCQENEPFQPVVASFGSNRRLDDMIDILLDHCRMYLLWDELLAGVYRVNPGQVRRFADELSAG